MAMHCSAFNSIGNLEVLIIRNWVGLVIMDAEFMRAILLGACRHILREQPGDLNIRRLALQYRQACIQALRNSIGGIPPVINSLTFAKALALAFDEFSCGEIDLAGPHLRGAITMAEVSGGSEALGLTELLEQMYQRLSIDKVSPELILVRCD
ncbi:hypothetical protein BN1723_014307 [Verticillium longisporum]|uniref:Uncharacterized protein n=1 Tax=Verticillium longisporum TaxID=100787 RepID=A0A0G4M6G0_VERLO|nr:hypothetical protein BN1723_014307 [Verticillium longisporum]